MTRSIEKDERCITYSYNVKDLSKEEMLSYIADILHADRITGHGVILTQPLENDDWPGMTKQLPFIPDSEKFAARLKDVPLTCVTAIMEYDGETLMLAYKPEANIIEVILPTEFSKDIDEIEKNVIPDAIDHNSLEEE
ncbi:MAG: hypothetical protein IJM63_13280 [Solobacterium sp.]|nr:hypothetical protein [Solobacterium sp.]MBQ9825466.1 hypothetical protein [Solobacterium sp.]